MQKNESICYYLNNNTGHIALYGSCSDYLSFNGKISSQKIVNSNIENLIISLCLIEPGSWRFSDTITTDFLIDSIKYCKESKIFPNLKNIYIFYNDSRPCNIPDTLLGYRVELVFFPFFLMRSCLIEDYYNVVDWERGNKKGVFIMGALDRLNRFPVLYEFYINNKVELLDYSCYINYYGDERTNNIPEDFFYDDMDKAPFYTAHWQYYMNGYDTNREELIQCYKKLTKQLDSEKFLNSGMDIFNRSATIVPEEWKDASLVLISETLYSLIESIGITSEYNSDAAEFTEKTWRPIATKKPFVTCSENDWVYKKLEKLGFKTFLEYTSHPEKVEISHYGELSAKHHAELTYKRVSSFLENLDKNKTDIARDVEHNHSHWKHLRELFWEKLYSQCPPLSTIKKSQVLAIFNQGGSDTLEFDINN